MIILVSEPDGHFELIPLLDTLEVKLTPLTATLSCTNNLLKNRKGYMGDFIPNLLLVFLQMIFQMVFSAILGLLLLIAIF